MGVNIFISDRLRMAKLDLNVNPADDPGSERRRQLKLSFEADAIKAAPIIKTPALPDRTRYQFLSKFIFFFLSKLN